MGGFPNRGDADSRRHGGFAPCHQRSDCERIIRLRSFGRWPEVEGRQPEPAAVVAGCGAGRHGPRFGGEDRRHGPPDAARLGPSLQRLGRGGSYRQLDRRAEASFIGGTTSPIRTYRRGRAGSREGWGRALAADRPQTRHRRKVWRRLPPALCRKAPEEAWRDCRKSCARGRVSIRF